ncbi:hypothetical protein [Sphingomonas sp. R86521]|uniref:hypothetical protein n=1 Tax=Sphingomonas sp. R86521 TaxID=3093860 RepID=UPI0036D32C76
MELRLSYAEAAARVADVIEAIVLTDAWEQHCRNLSASTFLEAREPGRQIFDAYEGREGEEWLGVLETMVIDEMRLNGPRFAANSAAIDAVVARLVGHPNVRLTR